jgi:hypothetical protein
VAEKNKIEFIFTKQNKLRIEINDCLRVELDYDLSKIGIKSFAELIKSRLEFGGGF